MELQSLNEEQPDFYHYEEAFAQLWTELGREVLESNLGEVPTSPRKNGCLSCFGSIEVAKAHRFPSKVQGFFISPYLQSLMARAGASDVYSEAHELLEQMLCIQFSRTQMFRVTDSLGEQLEAKQTSPADVPELSEDEVVYGSMDGSMIQTDTGWKEVKLGRVFRSGAVRETGKKQRHLMADSVYSACLGSCHEFLPRFEASLGVWSDQLERLVFITDGAEWIRHYLQEKYPDSTHILDYFHAAERLGEFARMMFRSEIERDEWIESQEVLLKAGKVADILKTLDTLTPLDKATCDERYKLMTYYRNNQSRMAYGDYRSCGLMIGSGLQNRVAGKNETEWTALEGQRVQNQ